MHGVTCAGTRVLLRRNVYAQRESLRPLTDARSINPALLSLLMVPIHYNDVIMSALASQFTSGSIVCSTVGSGADQRKHQSSASLAFVRGIHR